MRTGPGPVARRALLWSARPPLTRVWAWLYETIARWVARRTVPDITHSSVYLAGSVAGGDPVYGLSDIDLVVVADTEWEAREARRRFDELCRIPWLRGLIPHFWTFTMAGLWRATSGPAPVFEHGPTLVGPESRADAMGLLERPGLGDPTGDWRLVRGYSRTPDPPRVDAGIAAWLELQHRWRYAFIAIDDPEGAHAANHCVRLISDAARICLLLDRDELLHGRRAPLERALAVVDDEHDGLAYALDLQARLHRSPRVDLERVVPCFVRLSARIAELVDRRSFAAGATTVELVSGAGPELPLVDWRALAVPPEPDWSGAVGPAVAEELLRPDHGDVASVAVLAAAARRAKRPDVPVLRHGHLLLLPTLYVWTAGRLRLVQCRATDPVTTALLEGSATALFPDTPGWSIHDRARRAVAEQEAWLWADPGLPVQRADWLGPQPPSHAPVPATISLLLAAARAALLLESVAAGRPRLPLTLADTATALGERYPAAADAALAALGAPGGDVVGRLRGHVERMAAYSSPAVASPRVA